MTMQRGSMVRNLANGAIGQVILVRVPGMVDCALVRFDKNTSGGHCVPRNQLQVVTRAMLKIQRRLAASRSYTTAVAA
jgi:hypothetical protein